MRKELSRSLLFLVFCAALLLLWGGPAEAARAIDWNDRQISWQDYGQGLQLAKRTRKPVMLIFYADW